MGSSLIMEYYGYIKPNGTPPEINFWNSNNTITLSDDSVIIGYEGPQSKSDENVEIIGDAKAFIEWMKLNTPQNEEI